MTDLQKEIVSKLLLGYNIAATGANGYRLRSPEHHVCRKISVSTFHRLKKLLRKSGGGICHQQKPRAPAARKELDKKRV